MRSHVAIVEKDKCHPDKCQHECMKYDPVNRSGGEGFHIGESGKAEISEEVVQEFHSISAKKCPFQAIKIVKLPSKLTQQEIIHKFGKNSFELFRLPKLKENEVVGILGRNGIGKSTALNILSGNIKPNLGFYNKTPTEQEIIDKFSKSYLGDYFRKLFDKKIKISYKPQRVELIPKLFKNHSVIELIEHVDEKGISNKLLHELQLSHLTTRKLSELSGGELQRLSILATLCKKADIYYFDEPASFLDITARIKVAKLIRQIKNASVMVVEHDLATLDYISDEIQIIYGEQAAFGVLSTTKGVKRGINEYIDGFLPEDNVRFRSYKIVLQKPVQKLAEKETLFEFPELEKSYENFKLKINASSLKRSEVLSIVGSNGLGKTTFLKLLAGIETPDVRKLNKLKLAYKPQYIIPEDAIVEAFLKKKAGSEFDSGWYKTNIMEKLNIEAIKDNNLKTLSGGELQKVYIASCLSSDAELLAFDEPSAFVDVEDRLKVAEVIKEFTQRKRISSIVVDHDIQFIDYLADRMLVFEGTPGKQGSVYGPCDKSEGMNRVLKMLDITYRKDKDSGIHRVNKPDSQLDNEQKSKNKYYYN
jgi:ATP-binding cassette, sub-family E, member 1